MAIVTVCGNFCLCALLYQLLRRLDALAVILDKHSIAGDDAERVRPPLHGRGVPGMSSAPCWRR